MALKPIREMQYAENIGNPVFITDLAVLSQNIVELKAAINMFGKTTAIIYGFDKTEGGYTPGIVLHNKQLYSYAAGDVIPANTYLHSVVQQTTPRILENGSTFNAYVEYTFIANSTSTGDDLITPEPLTDDYVAELKNAAQGIPPITTDMIADGAVTAAKLAESYFTNRGEATDLNNALFDGVYTFDIDALNSPFDRGSVFVTHAPNNTVNVIQFAVGYESGNVNMILSCRYKLSYTAWSNWVKVWNSATFNPDDYLPLSGGKTITGDVGLARGKRLIEDGRNIIGRFAFGDSKSLRTIIGANIYEVLLISTAAIKRNTGGIEYTLWDSGNFNPSDYLSKENTTVYVPTGEYNPATKGYVDSAVENGSMKEVTTTNLNAILTEGTCFFTFPQSSTNAPTVDPGGGLQIDLTNKFVQFVTTFPSSSKAGPSFYRTSNTGSASTFSPWVCLAENGDFGQNVYFEQQLDATHFNDAPVIKKLVKRSYTNKFGPATVVLDNYASTQFPGTSSQYAPIAFRGYAKFTNYSTKATLAIVPVNSQNNNNYTFFTYVNPSSIYQVMANFTGGSASVREQVDYLVEITYGKVV